jgi:hypothetical protein
MSAIAIASCSGSSEPLTDGEIAERASDYVATDEAQAFLASSADWDATRLHDQVVSVCKSAQEADAVGRVARLAGPDYWFFEPDDPEPFEDRNSPDEVFVILRRVCPDDEIAGDALAEGLYIYTDLDRPVPAIASDASARNACAHYRNVTRDAVDGILTDAEVREKLKEVDSSAQVSDVAAVRRAARELLRTATSGDFDAFSLALISMDDGCASIGE